MTGEKGLLVALGVTLLLALTYSQANKAAQSCPVDDSCALPACRCSSQATPGGLQPLNTPQIVYITFDDAITVENYPFYEEVLFQRKNPNNASITATFFITHEYTNYSLVHELWRRGHDIALHSITHQTNTQYWAKLTEAEWRAEMADQRDQMSRFAAITKTDIQGVRAPFLQTSGNEFYKALSGANFSWECSRPTWNQRLPGLWPYTNDYLSTQDCQIPPCPNDKFPGFWTVPMLDLIGPDQFPCAMVDECTPVPMTADNTFNLLLKNFQDQYNGTRAPFGVFTHSAWMVGNETEFTERKNGFVRFLDHLATLRDVYVVSVNKGLEWVKDPTPVTELPTFTPWQQEAMRPNNCLFPRNCRYQNGTWERYMSSCVPCPTNYPWLNNPLGA